MSYIPNEILCLKQLKTLNLIGNLFYEIPTFMKHSTLTILKIEWPGYLPTFDLTPKVNCKIISISQTINPCEDSIPKEIINKLAESAEATGRSTITFNDYHFLVTGMQAPYLENSILRCAFLAIQK